MTDRNDNLELYCTNRGVHDPFTMTSYQVLDDGFRGLLLTPYYLPPDRDRVGGKGWSWDSFSLLCPVCHREPVIQLRHFCDVVIPNAIAMGLTGLDVSRLQY